MAEITLEGLSTLIEALDKKVDQLAATIKDGDAALEERFANVATLFDSVTDQVQQIAEGKKILKADAKAEAVIPKEAVSFNKKKYIFKVAKFRLPGDATIYLAEQAATEGKKAGGLIERILAIKGQPILVEQV